MKNNIKVTFFYRKPFEGNFSIEELFGLIRKSMPSHIDETACEMKYFSQGIMKRIRNGLFARKRQGEVNHITGDVNYIAMFLKKRKTVLTIHDLEVLKRNSGIKYKLLKLFWFSLPARSSRFITVISESTKKHLLEEIKIEAENVKVIYDCISPEIKYAPKEFDVNKPNILHIGTKHNKNLENTIKAISGLNVKLIILGKLKDHQEKLLLEHKIEFENYTNLPYSEVLDLYRRCDLLTFVSTSEGFGLPIVEANAIGRPVITGNTTSMPEIAGGSAILADPANIKEIRSGIEKIIDDKEFRDDLIKKGLENVKRFMPETIVNQFVSLYEKIALEK
jgi:glycosyltransferase involved in cell wall biosynthesis